jgi:hypothetical protein
MFASAFKLASKFTFPVIISSKLLDGTLESGIGSFVIINEDGWFVTAAHVINGLQLHQQHLALYQEYKNSTPTATIAPDNKWIINHSLWFGADHHYVKQFHILKDNDLAIGKLENYNPNFTSYYPKFMSPDKLEPATSLCKLGFPFYDIKADFDNANQRFIYDSSLFPIPMFPMEGMMTRIINTGKSQDGIFDFQWIETSTPGLRGQSGGPIFDKHGHIWAIQSQTRHLPLGFSPKIIKDEKEIEENQFLNVGWGVHVDSILKFLKFHQVKYYINI